MGNIIGCAAARDRLQEVRGIDVCPETVRAWMIRGILPGSKVGRDWVVDEDELNSIVEDPGFLATLPARGPGTNTTEKHQEIRRLLDLGRSHNEIARAVDCAPSLVSLIKNGYLAK